MVSAAFSLVLLLGNTLIDLFTNRSVDLQDNGGPVWAIVFAGWWFTYLWAGIAMSGRTVGKALVGLDVGQRAASIGVLGAETAAIERLNKYIPLARNKGDNGTAELLEHILKGEEHSANELEEHLHIIGEIGKENYLAQQIYTEE